MPIEGLAVGTMLFLLTRQKFCVHLPADLTHRIVRRNGGVTMLSISTCVSAASASGRSTGHSLPVSELN